MASELDNTRFNELVARIPAAAVGAPRKSAVNEAVTYLATTATLQVWARKLANNFGYRDRTGRDDIVNVIAEKVMKSLTAVTDTHLANVGNWASYLFGQAENAVKDYLASGQVTAASGMSGVHRRASTIGVARRDLLAELGREPSRDEIMAHANAHLLATRKDPARQGALIRESDFAAPAGPAVSVDAFAESGYDLPDEVQSFEQQVEAAFAIRRLLEWCGKEFPADDTLQTVAKVWVRLHLEGERVSVIRIANETGFSRAASKLALARLDSIVELMREFA